MRGSGVDHEPRRVVGDQMRELGLGEGGLGFLVGEANCRGIYMALQRRTISNRGIDSNV